MLNTIAVTLALTAMFAWFNRRFIGLPPTIGVMSIALAVSVALYALYAAGFRLLHDVEAAWLSRISFHQVLMNGMLSVLLFAGALHVDVTSLRSQHGKITLLALGGTLASTLIIGFGLQALSPWIGLGLPLAYCLVFGTLISPTDPIAVLGILRSAGAPRELEIVITGESLFNDGVGIAVFTLAVAMAAGASLSPGDAALTLLREGAGGIAFGAALGFFSFAMLKSIDSYMEEVLITLAAVVGGYAAALALGVSGPLTMVMAGLIVGNRGRAHAMSDSTREHLDTFWELLDGIFNAVLFVLIGLEAAVIPLDAGRIGQVVAVIALTLLARLAVAGLPAALLQARGALPPGAWQLLTWGGLRGGISVALALSLPQGEFRDTVVLLTYGVVAFSILGQGLSVGRLTRAVAQCDR